MTALHQTVSMPVGVWRDVTPNSDSAVGLPSFRAVR